jgi:hypothetical protein
MKRAIAEREFDCVDPSGTPFRTVVRIGAPVDHLREGNLAGYSTCAVSMEPGDPAGNSPDHDNARAGPFDARKRACMARSSRKRA